MIYVIGIGTQGRMSLTERSNRAINGAGLLAGGRRHLEEFPESGAKKAAIGGKGKSLSDISPVIEKFIKRKGKRDVAVLATGDPLLFGIADFIIKKFGKANVEVIPNVSIVQEAFARIKENWNGLKVLSVHGRAFDLDGICREAASNDKTAIFTDALTTPSMISKALIERGFTDFSAYVFEDLGRPGEKITKGALTSIIRRRNFSSLNLLVLLKKNNRAAASTSPKPSTERIFGIPDRLFSRQEGMITKEEIRVITLSKMDLGDNSAVWDIGSGCGSVAIEAARLAKRGVVYAFEKNKKRVADIRKNKESFNAWNLEVVHGVAQGCLKGRPRPDAVFIGGGGLGVNEILGSVSTALKKGGRVVINAVTIETAHSAFEYLKKKKWERELSLVNIARAKSLGDLNLLNSHNPVFIIKGIKP